MLLLLPRAIATSNLALSSSSSSWYHYCQSSSAARQVFDVHAAAASKSASSDIITAETTYRFGAKLRKHAIFSRRRHSGLPRTKTINRNNIKQQLFHLLSKLGCESCIVTILLFILHRCFVSSVTTTLSLQQQSLCKFITTNLTRWVTVSVFIKLLTLHSQITTITTDLSTAATSSSNYLNDDWFLKGQFYVVLPRKDDLTVLDCADDDIGGADTHNKTAYISVRVRQVANDGSCLFHSIGARILSDELIMMKQQEKTHDQHAAMERYPSMSRIMEYSSKLRLQAVNTLQYNPHQNFTILQYLNGDDTEEPPVVVETTTSSSSLISQAATQYGITQEEYLTSMKDDNVWGGGPEIAALASALQREIVLLETTTTTARTRSITGSYSATTNENDDDDNVHFLKVRARFRGDDDDSNNNAIYILSTNQRYPERYGRKGLDDNHFLAVFPSTHRSR